MVTATERRARGGGGGGVRRWGFSCQWLCLSRSPSTRPKFVLGLVRTQMAESTLGFPGSRAGQRIDTAQFPVELTPVSKHSELLVEEGRSAL